jgi:hypothetical protein
MRSRGVCVSEKKNIALRAKETNERDAPSGEKNLIAASEGQ